MKKLGVKMKDKHSKIKKIKGYNFKFICNIIPERLGDNVIGYSPKDEFSNLENKELNPYGEGTFCKFRIPRIKECGVYCLLEGNEVVYVGETMDLDHRFNSGYGLISSRNCFEIGQTINCKINSLIFRSCSEKKNVKLYFMKNSQRRSLKKNLMEILDPRWNEKEIIVDSDKVSNKGEKHSKYNKLYTYLRGINEKSLEMTFIQLEEILGFKLPKSAYSYSAWWANGGHSHSLTWLDAGYKVKIVSIGEKLIFNKVNIF
jgi:hypothetical protein